MTISNFPVHIKDNVIYFLSKAREKSLHSSHHKARIGAVLIRKGKIISKGFNKFRHARQLSKFGAWEGSLHAEVDCLKKVMFTNINNATLFVYREDKLGHIANSKPCEYCKDFMKFLKIKKVIYTISEFPYYQSENI